MDEQTDRAAARLGGKFGGRGRNHRRRLHHLRRKPASQPTGSHFFLDLCDFHHTFLRCPAGPAILSPDFALGSRGTRAKFIPKKPLFRAKPGANWQAPALRATQKSGGLSAAGGSFREGQPRLPGIGSGCLFRSGEDV